MMRGLDGSHFVVYFLNLSMCTMKASMSATRMTCVGWGMNLDLRREGEESQKRHVDRCPLDVTHPSPNTLFMNVDDVVVTAS